jgi:DNA-binding MarR family transcriptional regulator
MKFRDEATVFRELLGDTPKIRVLEYLLEGRELDHSIGDIAENSGINRVTLFRMWKSLEKANVIEHTRDIGNAKLFKINLENSLVKKLAELFDNTISSEFEKSAKIKARMEVRN